MRRSVVLAAALVIAAGRGSSSPSATDDEMSTSESCAEVERVGGEVDDLIERTRTATPGATATLEYPADLAADVEAVNARAPAEIREDVFRVQGMMFAASKGGAEAPADVSPSPQARAALVRVTEWMERNCATTRR